MINLKAGDVLSCTRLLRWFNEGNLHLQSAAAPLIVKLLYQLADKLPCPLIITSQEEGKTLDEEWDVWGDSTGFISCTRYRLIAHVLRGLSKEGLRRIPRIPLTTEEVKERLRATYERDELKVVQLLASQGSLSCTILRNWRLSRPVIRQTLIDLHLCRQAQVALASVITATRFKFYDKLVTGATVRVPTQCRICGQMDGPEHLLTHVKGEMPVGCPEDLVAFLVNLAEVARARNPQTPTPYPLEVSAEIELDLEMEHLWETASLNSLSVDKDDSDVAN